MPNGEEEVPGQPNWVDRIRDILSKIADEVENKDIDKIDRYNKVYSIAMCATAVMKSMEGWLQWVNTFTLKKFSQDDLDMVFRKLVSVSMDLLSMDIELTQKYSGKPPMDHFRLPDRETHRQVMVQ